MKDRPTIPPQQTMPQMLPDTVYQKPLKPIDRPLPVRGINTVHDTSFGDTLYALGMSFAGAKFSKP